MKVSNISTMPLGLIAAAAAVCAFGLAACGDDSSDTAAGGESATTDGAGLGAGKKIVFIVPSLDREFYIAEKQGAEQMAKKYPDADISVVAGAGAGTAEELTAEVENSLAKGAEAIAINATSPEELKPVLQRAVSEGVAVILYDNVVEDFPEATTYVGANNVSGGEMAAAWLLENYPEGGNIGLIHCYAGVDITDDRIGGFEKGISGSGWMVLQTLDAKCERALGRSKMENMLSANPDLDAVFSISDAQTLGAVQAVKASGSDPIFISWDGVPEALALLKAGEVVDAEVAQHPIEMGELALEAAVQAASDEPVEKEIEVPLEIVDKDNVAEFEASQK